MPLAAKPLEALGFHISEAEAFALSQPRLPIQTVDGWKDRLNLGTMEFPQLPENPAEVRPVNFIDATRSADRIDPGVASYMQVGLHFITEAEIAINLLRASDSDHQSWMQVRDKAVNSLSTARLKLDEARTRLNGQRRFS